MSKIKIINGIEYSDDMKKVIQIYSPNLVIADSVIEIAIVDFKNCIAISFIEFKGTIAQWEAVSGKADIFLRTSVKSVKCADGVWERPIFFIEKGILKKCIDNKVTRAVIPEKVTEIALSAFSGCKSLASIVIPESVTKIDIGAFKEHKSLSSVEFKGTISQWEEVSGKLSVYKKSSVKNVKCADGIWERPALLIEKGIFEKCFDNSVSHLVIPEKVTEISYHSFFFYDSLSSIVIPESVTKIDIGAFKEHKSLSSVKFKGTIAQWEEVSGKLSIYENTSVKSVKCADGVWQKQAIFVENGIVAKCFDDNISTVQIPAGVTKIDDKVFIGYQSISSVEFGGTKNEWESVKGNFQLISYVKSVKCADGVWERPAFFIESGILKKCFDNSASHIVIPEKVIEIALSAFNDCESLSSIVIPESVTKIDIGAFKEHKSLSSVEFKGTISQWEEVSGKLSIYENTSVKNVKCADGVWQKPILLIEDMSVVKCMDKSVESVEIPENMLFIGEQSFIECHSLKTISIPNGVAEIQKSAFLGCESLSSIVIPESVIRICADSFLYCFALSSIEIPESVVEIGEGAFSVCTSLDSIVIPRRVTKIENFTFYYCTKLASVVIPESVKEIGRAAFKECFSLSSVKFGGTIAQWKAIFKGANWEEDIPAKTVECADGRTSLE